MQESKSPSPLTPALTLTLRPMADFKALPEKGRPGGSSADIQFFGENSTDTLWIGKCGNQALSIPAARFPGYGRYYEEYKEWLGLALYRLFGIEVPDICLSEQKAVKPREMAVDTFDYRHPCLHIMSRFVTGFQPLGERFLGNYQASIVRGGYQRSQIQVQVEGREESLPLQGFGAALAVACFLYDLDCLGRSGGNMGYVVAIDAQGKAQAKTVKIDPGFAFSFTENIDDVSYRHDPRARNIRFAPGRLANGQTCLIRYDQLSLQDQAEFAATARRILQTPKSVLKAIIDQVVVAEGFTRKQADDLLTGLLARKAIFLTGFAPEVSEALRNEALEAKKAFLRRILPAGREEKERKREGKSEPLAADSAEQKQRTREAIEGLERQLQQVHLDHLALAQAEGGARQQDDEKEAKDRKAVPVKQQQFQVPQLTPYFTARGELLQQLAEQLHTQRGSVINQTISGLGGVGKTQLAIRYAQAALAKEKLGSHTLTYDAVIWLHAEGNLGLQFVLLAESLCKQPGLKEEEAITAVYRYFQNKRVLLMFDNAETQEAIQPYLPASLLSRQSPWHVLITSRNPSWQSIPTLPVGEFSPADARRFISEQLPEVREAKGAKEKEVQALLDTVTCLPLALTQAVAYIKAGHATLAAYPQQFVLHQLSLGQMPGESAAEETLLTTFLLSAARIEHTYPGAMTLLRTCAYLAPEGIPTAWLKDVWQTQLKQNPADFDRVLAALSRQGLIQEQPGKNTVDMHRLLQQAILSTLPIDLKAQQLTQVMKLLARSYPEEGVGSLADQARWAFLPHLMAVTAHSDTQQRLEDPLLANILMCTAAIYNDLGDVAKQRDLLERALRIQEAHYGREHVQVAITLTNLGIAYNDLGDVAKGRDVLERALRIKEMHYGREHFQVAITLTNLSNAYSALGDAAKKRDLLERALRIEEAHYGREHFQVAGTLANLGIAYGDLGDAVKQRDFLERALRIFETHYGREHFKVAGTLASLGNAYGELGDPTKQRDLVERALRIKEAHYGREHVQVATTLTGLASAYSALGDVTKQRDILERALRIFEAHYGREHFNVAITLTGLGNAYGKLGDVAKKRDLLERALPIQEAHYGREHVYVAITLGNLSNAYGDLGDVAKQRDLLERALHIDEAHYGCDHPQVTFSLANLVIAYHQLKQIDLALQTAKRAYGILISHPNYGERHPHTQQWLKVWQSQCGITPQMLLSAKFPALLAAKTPPPGESKSASPSSPALLLGQRGLLKSPREGKSEEVQQTKQALGQTTVAFVQALNHYLHTKLRDLKAWDAQAASSFVGGTISAIAKGGNAYENMLAKPESHSLPKPVAVFIQQYVLEHPILKKFSEYNDFAGNIKRDLYGGKLADLAQRFGAPVAGLRASPAESLVR